jgi:IS5 family transposase
LPTHSLFETYQKDFLFYQQVLAQQPKDKNKIYSLHEPDVYVIAKGKASLLRRLMILMASLASVG